METTESSHSGGLDTPICISSDESDVEELERPTKSYEAPPSPEWFRRTSNITEPIPILSDEEEAVEVQTQKEHNPPTSSSIHPSLRATQPSTINRSQLKQPLSSKNTKKKSKKPYEKASKQSKQPNKGLETYLQEEKESRARHEQIQNVLAPAIPARPPWICPYTICEREGKPFSKKAGVQRHVKTSHLNIRDHICDRCGTAFSRADVLKRTHRPVCTGVPVIFGYGPLGKANTGKYI